MKKDSVVLVVGKWDGIEAIWRGGVFDDEEQARDEFNIYNDKRFPAHPNCEFVRFQHVKLDTRVSARQRQ